MQHGIVLASSDGGSTWSDPLDDFTSPGFHMIYGGGIASDAAGNLYVTGLVVDDSPLDRQEVLRRDRA
jgi:hypothetical protein